MQSVCLSVCMPVIRPSLCPPNSQSIRLSFYVYVYLHVRLFLIDYPPVCLFVLWALLFLPVWLPVCLIPNINTYLAHHLQLLLTLCW